MPPFNIFTSKQSFIQSSFNLTFTICLSILIVPETKTKQMNEAPQTLDSIKQLPYIQMPIKYIKAPLFNPLNAYTKTHFT